VPQLALAVIFSPLVLAAGALVWGCAALLIDAGQCRRHPRVDLADRLAPSQPSVADEAEAWLRRQ
jgi:hypothetical protein